MQTETPFIWVYKRFLQPPQKKDNDKEYELKPVDWLRY